MRVIRGTPVLTTREAARVLGCSPWTVGRAIDDGSLRAIRVRERGWRYVPLHEVERLLVPLNDDDRAGTRSHVRTSAGGGGRRGTKSTRR